MRHRFRLPLAALLAVCLAAAGVMPGRAATVKKQNLADLISLGEVILHGTVTAVSDGFDANNVPYTEVTVDVRETAKGEASDTYTFRQFGLTRPRDMGNGLVNLNVTPDGWPTYSQGEEVMLFLYKAAGWTGLRTTVGLFQGKFTVVDGMVSNVVDNDGLFKNVRVDPRQLSPKERDMLKMDHGRVPVDVFMSFVNKAVQQRWFVQEGE